jgi:hypothetical protein
MNEWVKPHRERLGLSVSLSFFLSLSLPLSLFLLYVDSRYKNKKNDMSIKWNLLGYRKPLGGRRMKSKGDGE